ncbi:hypothetical protein VTJ04DRAFT_6063 [Mycothermus thermophilus]|uniref:uncharacterized protein n=1 Tax=Humicola insolens TaxID=85995 RepID=UPI00374466D6
MSTLPPQDFLFLPIPSAPDKPLDLTLLTSSTWTYCGPLLPLDDNTSNNDNVESPPNPSSSLFPPSFHAWTAQTISGPQPSAQLLTHLLPLLRAAHAFLISQNMHHYWLTIRATKPTTDFDFPRWHTDDNFFIPPRQPDSDPDEDGAEGLWKLCATLQGRGTLFFSDGKVARRALKEAKAEARKEQERKPHVCTTVRCAACGRTSEWVREEVAGRLARVEEEGKGRKALVVQPVVGKEMAFFRIGGKEGAVHSEPRHDGDRVFVNIIPGTEEELRGLTRRWGMEFPRSWSLGVPGMGSVAASARS